MCHTTKGSILVDILIVFVLYSFITTRTMLYNRLLLSWLVLIPAFRLARSLLIIIRSTSLIVPVLAIEDIVHPASLAVAFS